MIKAFSAYTLEIDDVEAAVEEVLEKLDLENNLSQNSVGVIACHYEFLLSGVVKALCERLPFPVAGAITSSQAVDEVSDILLLTLLVLTGDEVVFETALSPSLLNDPAAAIEEAYRTASAGHDERPALILPYAAFLVQNSGDQYVETLTKISEGVPCFGSLAVDDTVDFHNSFAVLNGEHYRDRMALILIYGNIQPKFYTATISESKIIDKAALVTASEGHILKEVNGRPVFDYFESLGLAKASETSYAMSSLPFMLDYNDGTPPVSKVFVGLNEEKQAICAGAMPVGATLYIGVADGDDVVLTTGQTMDRILDEVQDPACMLMYSCISRSMSLGGESLREMELVREKIDAKIPFMMAYSGGEICPTTVSHAAVNRFHNNTFILCVF